MNFYSIAEIFTQKRKEANEASPVIPRKLRDTHIQDENQSVKWNREYVVAFNNDVNAAHNKAIQAEYERNNQFQEACMKELSQFPLPTAQLIWSRAYDAGHANGYPSIAEKLDTYAEFASDLIKSLPENSA